MDRKNKMPRAKSTGRRLRRDKENRKLKKKLDINERRKVRNR